MQRDVSAALEVALGPGGVLPARGEAQDPGDVVVEVAALAGRDDRGRGDEVVDAELRVDVVAVAGDDRDGRYESRRSRARYMPNTGCWLNAHTGSGTWDMCEALTRSGPTAV